uniref:Uncharacterized protein n=1 Tax=Nonomuraea gerenzanensis TaxID=93944 RepID=A0A1M4ED63_9ACTN|nr:hypothetical protein BN4615_P6039 [Nonomuraea gerenzanensis]
MRVRAPPTLPTVKVSPRQTLAQHRLCSVGGAQLPSMR